MRILIATVLLVLNLFSCEQRELTGVIQTSKWSHTGWEFALGTSENADYVFVETKVLLDTQEAVYYCWRIFVKEEKIGACCLRT